MALTDPSKIDLMQRDALALKASATALRSQMVDGSPIALHFDSIIADADSVADLARKGAALARKAIAEDKKAQIEAEIAHYDSESKR